MHSGQISDYQRTLELDTAIATVQYRVEDTTFVREIFSSAVDDVIIVRFTCDKPGTIFLTVSMESPHPSMMMAMGGDRIRIEGRCPQHVDPHYHEVGEPIIYVGNEPGKGMHFEG